MMLPGHALVAQGTQIHIVAWPFGTNGRVLSQALTQQGACYVIAVGAAWKEETAPEALIELEGPGWAQGEPGSCIIGPGGNILAEVPTKDDEAIITAEGSLENVLRRKVLCDIASHYSRPDVFQLHVKRTPHRRVVEMQEPEHGTAESEAISDE